MAVPNPEIEQLEAESKNNSNAAYKLGLYYLNGYNTVPINEQKAVWCFNLACTIKQDINETGYIESNARIGVKILSKENVSKGLEYLEWSAERNSAFANLFLGYHYGCQQDQNSIKKSIDCFKAARMLFEAEARELKKNEKEIERLEALHYLSDIYVLGAGGAINLKKSFEYLLELAEKGHAKTQFSLCEFWYLRGGEQTPQSLEKALYFLKKSAAQKYTDAMDTLARCYQQKQSVGRISSETLLSPLFPEKNLKKAVLLYEESRNICGLKQIYKELINKREINFEDAKLKIQMQGIFYRRGWNNFVQNFQTAASLFEQAGCLNEVSEQAFKKK